MASFVTGAVHGAVQAPGELLKKTRQHSIELTSKSQELVHDRIQKMKIEIPKPPPEKYFGIYVAVTIVVNVGIFLGSQLYGYYAVSYTHLTLPTTPYV